MQHDDDLAVGGPILFVILVIFGIGIYNEIESAFSSDAASTAVEEATAYAERAEAELRAAQEEADRAPRRDQD